MFDINTMSAYLTAIFPTVVSVLIIVIAALAVYKILTAGIRRAVMFRAKSKKQKNNALVFLSLWKYSFAVLLVIGLIFYLGGDITGLGLWAGLMTASSVYYRKPGAPRINGHPYGFSSNHPGGCHFALCDGSVRFIEEDINALTVDYLIQIQDGHVIDEF